MLKWFLKKRDPFYIENKSIAQKIYLQALQLNEENKYKARVVLDFVLKAFKSNESLQELYEKVYMNQDLKKIEAILSFESPFKNQKYKHYKGNLYKTMGVAIPVKKIKEFDDYFIAKHTEDNENITIYMCKEFLYHDYNDDVLMIYSGDTDIFARPHEMFFSTVEVDGNIYPRFAKKEE